MSNSFDWAAAGSWLQAIAGFAAAGAVLYAAHRGSASFDQWLRQRQTERKIVAGERILAAIYQAKDAFPAIRSPLHRPFELDAALAQLKKNIPNLDSHSNEKVQRFQVAQVVMDRVNHHSKTWDELFNCLPTARAFYGPEMEDTIKRLLGQRSRLSSSAQMYANYANSRNDEFTARTESDLWSGFGTAADLPDEIQATIDEVMRTAEDRILPIIAGPTVSKKSVREIVGQFKDWLYGT